MNSADNLVTSNDTLIGAQSKKFTNRLQELMVALIDRFFGRITFVSFFDVCKWGVGPVMLLYYTVYCNYTVCGAPRASSVFLKAL